MCDCRSKNEERLIEHFAKQLPEGATGLKVTLGGYAMIFSGPVSMKNYSEVTATYSSPTKGSAKKPSRMREHKETVSLLGNYCMFCGVEYPKNEAKAVQP